MEQTTDPLQPASPAAPTAPESASELRVSPYPLRKRTPPPRSLSPEAARPCQRSRNSPGTAPPAASPVPSTRQTPRAAAQSGSASPLMRSGRQQSPLMSTPAAAQPQRLQLVIQPIVKVDVTQREASGETLEDFAASGTSFKVIMEKVWQQFSSRVQGLAVKHDGKWKLDKSGVPLTAWSKVMQFKMDPHLVSSTKSDVAWNRWVTARRGETVKLLIYEYGMAIVKTKDFEDFRAECIRPHEVDRSGATAESGLRDVVDELHDVWGATFQAPGIVWRMWGNEITRNLDRSTWDTAILDSPPDHVMRLLKPADTQVDRQLTGLTQTAKMRLDCVNASIADNLQLLQDVNALRQRVDTQASSLATRKLIIEAFLADIPPVSADQVTDPLDRLQNVDDDEHQE